MKNCYSKNHPLCSVYDFQSDYLWNYFVVIILRCDYSEPILSITEPE